MTVFLQSMHTSFTGQRSLSRGHRLHRSAPSMGAYARHSGCRPRSLSSIFFFFNDTATTEIYTLSLHDALPICRFAHQAFGEVHHVRPVLVGAVPLEHRELGVVARGDALVPEVAVDLEHALDAADQQPLEIELGRDRKSTRLNSSHANISYAVFC